MTPPPPHLEDHLPDLMAFVRQMAAAYINGEFDGWGDITSRFDASPREKYRREIEAFKEATQPYVQ